MISSAHARAVGEAEGVRAMGMPSAERVWLAADLADLPDDGNRYEVIDGELHVTPAPSLNHQEAVARLYMILAPYVDAQRCGHAFIGPADITFSPARGVQPDVFVMPRTGPRRPRTFIEVGRLLLAAEVLSASTARWDRVTKRKVYREHNVPEYWIVDLDARAFERSTPADEKPEVIRDRLTWQPEGAAEPLVIDVPQYFRDVLDA
jgi:Uma2 family endonuclease